MDARIDGADLLLTIERAQKRREIAKGKQDESLKEAERQLFNNKDLLLKDAKTIDLVEALIGRGVILSVNADSSPWLGTNQSSPGLTTFSITFSASPTTRRPRSEIAGLVYVTANDESKDRIYSAVGSNDRRFKDEKSSH